MDSFEALLNDSMKIFFTHVFSLLQKVTCFNIMHPTMQWMKVIIDIICQLCMLLGIVCILHHHHTQLLFKTPDVHSYWI